MVVVGHREGALIASVLADDEQLAGVALLAGAASISKTYSVSPASRRQHFGTGQARLKLLRQDLVRTRRNARPIDFLKIDGSFVNNMLIRPESSMVEAIVQLSRTLGVVPIAEGVESEAQATALLEFGCDLAQGYFLARPLGADALHELLLESRELPALSDAGTQGRA